MSIYKNHTPEEQEEILSSFLVDSWSYSKIASFARNEKAFEMQYIFGLNSRSGASTIAGEAYHTALQYYFTRLKEGVAIDIVELEASAFGYIGNVRANKWKLQKTTPTVEECVALATKNCTNLLRNFYAERSLYEEDIESIIEVECYFDEYVTVNGADIPLPAHGKIDLIVRTKDGKLVVIDHKSKSSYTDEEEATLSIGVQAMTYVVGYEAKYGMPVDEVWFIENKHSQNKDKSAQLRKIPVVIDENTRKLYEALLYEPLKRMIQAVRDPDYVYLINESDNYVDRAELYDFWCRTMICDIDDFNVDPSKKVLVAKRLKKIRDASIQPIDPVLIKRFKENASKFIQYDLTSKNMTKEEKIEHVLRTFGIITRVAFKFEGYSSDTFLLEVSAGIKVGAIYKYNLDIANALDVTNVRLSNELVVHEGKSYLSIDIAKKRERTLVFNPSDLQGMRIPIGKDNFDQTIVWDLDNHSTPHVLICGGTGSGKSVSILSTIEYAKLAGVTEIIVLDPKYEFTNLDGVTVINDIEAIELKMKQVVEDMENRVKTGNKKKTLVVFDEFADAVANARSGAALKIYENQQEITATGMIKTKRVHVGEEKSLEENLRILLQKGRSSGFRVIAATQRASVKVITGDAKVNFPVQICFRVPKEADSRVVLDEAGAESLAGMGDGLIKSPEYRDTVRFQAYYKSTYVTA